MDSMIALYCQFNYTIYIIVSINTSAKRQFATEQRGFTLVELLIVIVVIAILAAISIVAYNGVQQRARNSSIANLVQSYKQTLASYAIDNGGYPSNFPNLTGTNISAACIGTGYPSQNCWSGTNGTISEQPAFVSDLSKYVSTVPTWSGIVSDFTGSGTMRSGAAYEYQPTGTYDGKSPVVLIIYYIEGNGPCPVGPIATETSSGVYTSTPPASGYSVSFGKSIVQCDIVLQ